MIRERHPVVAELIVGSLASASESPCLGAVHAAQELDGVGFVVPEWTCVGVGCALAKGAQRAGWQHEAASCVERHCRATSILPHLSPTRRAMLRSKSGPSSCLHGWNLLSSVALPFLLTKRICRCGCLLDAFGNHRASRVLGFSLESAAARVCRGAGGRVATNLSVRDMDLGESRMPTTTDVWRLWPTVCHSSVACSFLLTPLWCLQIRVTANRRAELLPGMV